MKKMDEWFNIEIGWDLENRSRRNGIPLENTYKARHRRKEEITKALAQELQARDSDTLLAEYNILCEKKRRIVSWLADDVHDAVNMMNFGYNNMFIAHHQAFNAPLPPPEIVRDQATEFGAQTTHAQELRTLRSPLADVREKLNRMLSELNAILTKRGIPHQPIPKG